MPDFEVQIKTPVELAGAKALAEALEAAIVKTKALGESTEELEGQLKKVREGIKGASDEAKHGEEGFKVLGRGAHEAHAGLRALNEAFPGLEQFSRFLASGMTAAIGGVLLLFSYLKDKIDEFSKTLDSISTETGARGEWAEKIRDNVREAAVEVATFDERLRELGETQDALTKSTDALIARQKTMADDARAVADAQKELDLARVALAEKLHQITPDQAVRIRLEIDDAAFKRELDAKKAEIQAELSARQQEFDANQDREPSLNSNMERANAAALAAENARDKNAAKLAQDKANLDALKDKMAAAEASLEERSHGIAGIKVPESELAHDMAYQAAQAQLTQIYRLQNSYQTSIRQESGRETPLATAAAVANQQAAKAQADYEEAAKLSHETLETIQKLKADLTAANARSTALQSIHNQTSAVRRQGVSVDTANRVAEGHGTPDDIAEVEDWRSQEHFAQSMPGDILTNAGNARSALYYARSAVQSGHGNDQQLRSLMNEFIGLAQDIHASTTQRSEFNDLARQVQNLRLSIHNNRTSP